MVEHEFGVTYHRQFLVWLALSMILLPLTGALNVAGLIVLVIVQGVMFGMIPTNIFAAAGTLPGAQGRKETGFPRSGSLGAKGRTWL